MSGDRCGRAVRPDVGQLANGGDLQQKEMEDRGGGLGSDKGTIGKKQGNGILGITRDLIWVLY